jgi:hypothetical protein
MNGGRKALNLGANFGALRNAKQGPGYLRGFAFLGKGIDGEARANLLFRIPGRFENFQLQG